MKKLLSILLVLSLLTMVFPASAQAETIAMSEKKMELVHGDTFTLKVLNVKERETIVWNTTNKNVATVTSDGVVSADNVGNAIITARVGKTKYTCKITVVENVNNASPHDIYRFVTMDILNGFYMLDNFARFSESSHPDDFETTLENLNKNMKKLSQYNEKVIAYEGEEYDDLKEAWDVLYNEILSLYGEFEDNPPKVGKVFEWLDFKNVDKYKQLFLRECMYFE